MGQACAWQLELVQVVMQLAGAVTLRVSPFLSSVPPVIEIQVSGQEVPCTHGTTACVFASRSGAVTTSSPLAAVVRRCDVLRMVKLRGVPASPSLMANESV